jgi:hypothetical protein
MVDLAPPDPGELEVSLFGPGYGEGIALHLGGGRWMIVDSCVDANTNRAAPLAYLEAIGVDPAKDVSAVLATHWHDDHVRGLGEVLDACETATFFCSVALRSDEFLELTQAKVLGAERTTSGVREFSRMLGTVRERKAAGISTAGPAFLLENTVVDRGEYCDVTALSPSSAAVERAMAAVSAMLPERRRPHLRVAAPSKNEGSVALWMSGQAGCALLAADLEREVSDDRGWGAVLALSPAATGRAGLANVAHHGSESSHDQRAWDELLEGEPQAFLTPWSRGARTLPTETDRDRLKGLAPDAVQVGRHGGKPKDRYDPPVERVLKEVSETRRVALGRIGHARARCSPDDDGHWRMERVAEAFSLADAG